MIQPRFETILFSELQVLSLTGSFTPCAQRKGRPPDCLAHDQLCSRTVALDKAGKVDGEGRSKWNSWKDAAVVQAGVTEAISCLGCFISPCSIRKREAGNICISNRRQFDTGD